MKRWITTLSIFGCIIGGTQAAVLISDNFNGSINAGWTITQDVVSGSVITNTGAESAFSAVVGGTSLSVDNGSTTAEPQLRYDFAELEEGNSLVIKFDYYNIDATLPILRIYDANNQRDRLAHSTSADVWQSRNGGGWTNLTAAVDATWYQLTYTLNNDVSDTVDISIQEFGEAIQTFTDVGADGSASFVDNIRFDFNIPPTTAGNEFLIDNLSVEVIPEPATLGLIGAVSMGALFIRRRFMM